MKARYMITCLVAVVLCAACERDLDFKGPSEEIENDLVINAVAVEDSPITVYLTRAYPVGKTPTIQYYDYEHAVFLRDETSTDYLTDDYVQKTAVRNAQVTVEVNGKENYTTTFDEESLAYLCDYLPQSGDNIRIIVEHEGQEVYAETTLPDHPKIEIVGHEVISGNPYRETEELFNRVDTIMRLTFRIIDGGGERYYRLRVRSERDDHYTVMTSYNKESQTATYTTLIYYYMQDIFFSEDELFRDISLTSGFGGWPAHFSTVFDNSLMKGSTYTFTVDSPKAGNTSGFYRILNDDWKTEGPKVSPRVMVELQAISPELYHYLKSAQLYRVTSSDEYAEPVQIYSNVQNGWGILGALSYDRHFVEYGE